MMTAGCVADMKAYRENHGSMAFPAEAEKGAGVRFPSAEPDLAFYANGWQSWSYSGLIEATQSMPGTRLGPIRRTMVDRPGKIPPRGQGRVDSDMFAVLLDRLNPIGVLAGFLSQREAFGSVASSMKREIPSLQLGLNLDRARLDPGESFRSDWACLNFINTLSEDPLSAYLEMVAQENSTRVDSPTPQGWCSWYYYYQKIEALSIKGQIEWAEKNQREIPLHIIQIDDGYQAHIGDWLKTNNQFPGGMAHLAGEIKEAGLEAGLWLAPFIALRNAQVVKQNPDWILRSRFGLPANTGLVWETFGRALDVTHPGVLEHLTNVFTTVVKDWGYSYLKLDFLYTAALAGRRYDPRRTGAQAIYQMLTKIREIVGEETTLVGCGCPLGSGLGIFDVMRIGPDVAPSWTPKYAFLDAFLQKEFDIPSARNAIHNTLTRAPFHRRWWVNDPDCLLIREAESDLSSAEVQTLATVIALSGGAVMVSDDMLALDEERRRWLAQMLPALPGRMRIVDFFEEGRPKLISLDLSGPAGEWRLLAILNWEDQECQFDIHLDDFELDSSLEYHSVDFWNARYESVSERVLSTGPIAAHGVKLIALREASEGPLWVGDTVHISQGLCVKSWDHHEQTTTSVIDCGRRAQGKVWFSLPAPPGSLRLNGVEMDFEQVHHQVYAFSLDIEGSATLAIEQS
jgi:alpha-galactosidase